MRATHLATSILAAAGLFGLLDRPAKALPTMIRLGYTNCASCHISPQGGGLLNLYGRGIDQAQSLSGGEYAPSRAPWVQDLNWLGRMTQDIRIVTQQQNTSTTNRPGTQLLRSRFMYRNATELGHGFRFTATITGENAPAPRPSLSYDPPAKPAKLFINTALLSYRAAQTFEFAIGRDQLPSGVGTPDLSAFVRSRNRLGYYDSPTQVKVFWWGKRYLFTPYGFGPGGNEKPGFRETGWGALAELDPFGKQKTILGINFLRGTANKGDRTLVGPYLRLGFNRWGILGEHDITIRSMKTATPVFSRQNASYAQIFFALREWLVPSLIAERLEVARPYPEHLTAMRIELAARLRSQVSISAGPRIQWDALTRRTSRSIVFQLGLKTVH